MIVSVIDIISVGMSKREQLWYAYARGSTSTGDYASPAAAVHSVACHMRGAPPPSRREAGRAVTRAADARATATVGRAADARATATVGRAADARAAASIQFNTSGRVD